MLSCSTDLNFFPKRSTTWDGYVVALYILRGITCRHIISWQGSKSFIFMKFVTKIFGRNITDHIDFKIK